MADKKEIKIKLSSDDIIKQIEKGVQGVSFDVKLDTDFGKHEYVALDKKVQEYLKSKNAVVISATQFAHLMETGYASFEAEISDLEKKIKTSTGEEKTKLQQRLKDVKKFSEQSMNKAHVGTEIHKLLELQEKGFIDLNKERESLNKIYAQMNKDKNSLQELRTLVGSSSFITDNNFKKAFRRAQEMNKMMVSAGMTGGQAETARAFAYIHNGKLYVAAGATDWTKTGGMYDRIGDYKTTSEFNPVHNLIQTAVNANAMRAASGNKARDIKGQIVHLPVTKDRNLNKYTAGMVYDISTGSWEENMALIQALTDVYEGKGDRSKIKIPGRYTGGVTNGIYTDVTGAEKTVTYWNGKTLKKWLKSDQKDTENMIDSLSLEDKNHFLKLLFGQSNGNFWYTIGSSDELRKKYKSQYDQMVANKENSNYYLQDIGGSWEVREDGSWTFVPRESTSESRQKASKNMYNKDWWEIAQEQDENRLINDFSNNRKDIDEQTAAQMVPVAARRLARIIDYSNKVDRITQEIIKRNPELEDRDVEEVSKEFLKATNPKNLDRYLRSKELLAAFPKEGAQQEKYEFAYQSLREDSNEESKLKNMLYIIEQAGLLDEVKSGYMDWEKYFFKQQKSIPYSVLTSMVTGKMLGYEEDELRPEYAEQRSQIKTLTQVDEKYISDMKDQIADEILSTAEDEIGFFKRKISELGKQKGLDEDAINSALEKVDYAVEDTAAQSIEDVQKYINSQYDTSEIESFEALHEAMGVGAFSGEETLLQEEFENSQDNLYQQIDEKQKEFEVIYRTQVQAFNDYIMYMAKDMLSLANEINENSKKNNKKTQQKQKQIIDQESKKVEESSKEIAQNIVNNAIDNAIQQTEEVALTDASPAKITKEENKPVLKDGVYVWSRTGRRLSAKQLSSRGLQNNPPAGNIQYSGGPIPVYPAGQGGDLDPNKIYKETGITVDAENKIVSRTLKEVQKRKDSGKRGSSQLDVIKQIKEDTGKIVNIMEQQPPVSGGGMPPEIPTGGGGTSNGGRKGKSKEDKQKEKEEKQKQKEEKQAAAQRKKDNQEYAKALKTEYDYQLKIDDARRKSNITSGRERKSQQEFIKVAQQQLKIAQLTTQEKRKAVTDKDAALIESGLQGQFSVKRAAMYTKDKGARNIFDLMGDDIKRAFQRITDFGVAARILNKVQKEIANVYQNILKLNEAMTDIRIVTGASVDEANSLMTSYNKLAKELGTTTTEVAKSASEWMRQGYSASESVNLITSSVKLARLGFMDMSSATTSLTAVLKGFNLQATESSKIVDKLTKLDAEYATTAGDIATALSRTAAAAKAANLDLDQTASMLTTIIDITQQDAGSVGNALKTILSRYGNVKAGVFAGMEEDGEDASESINDVEKVLNAIGIQIRSTSTEMRGFDEVLDDLAEKWDNLNDVEQNAVATAMAGVRQRNQFLALMQNYDQYRESLESSRASSGTADEKYAAVMDSIATSMQRIQTAWESFTQKLQASEFVKGFFKAIAGVVENIDKILPNIVAMLININAKHLPVLGMKIKSLFGGKSAAANWFKGSFGGSKTLVEQQLLEKAKYRVGLVGEEGLTPEERAILNGSKVQQPKSYTEELLKQIADNTAGIKRNTSNSVDDQSPVKDTPIADIGGGNKPSLIKRFGKSFGRNLKTYGIISGIGAGISSGMTANYGDFTSGADKAVTGLASGVATGLLSAVPVVGPLLGSILGPLIGQGLGKIFYDEFHKEEIARRKRVDEAKKQLEATQKVETAITSAEELISKDRSEWGSEEYKQEKELIDQMRLGLQTSSSLAENFAKLSGKSVEASDWILKLSSDLTKLDESVVANYRAAQILTEAQETYKAGEEDRAALYDKLGSAESSMLNQIQNMDSASSEYLEKRKEYESEYGRTVESGIASMQQAQMQLDAFTDALHEGYMKAAFYSSGVSQMSSTDIAGASLDRVVAEVARAWAASDATALVFANGTLLDSARKQIVAYLKTQSDFTSLTKSPGGSLRDIMDARDEIGSYLQGTKGDYEKLKNIVNQQDFKAIREFFGYNAESNENDSYIKDLIDQINKADPSNIELIAHGMNITVEQAESLKSVIGSISLEDVLNGADKLLDKFETLNGILGDISEDTILSPENMNKVVSAFPDLFKEFDENGNFTGNISSGNIVGNLAKLVTDPNGALATAYAGLAAKGSLTDKNKWKIFQDSVKANKEALLTSKVITDKQFSDIMTAKDFNSQAQLMLNNGKLMEEWAKIVSETTAVADYAEQARNILIEAENKSLEKQIDNLQSIKDSIGDINKQREKELDLIKARDALENAKKDKKLVYRAGIGFVAQADTSAIQEAQKKVDDLQNQQTQEDLQYQIDQLNQQKAILQAIQEDPKVESIKKSAEEIKDALVSGGDGTVLGYLQTLSTDTFVNNIKNAILESIKENTANVGKEEYKSELKTYNKMISDYDDLLNSKYKDSNLYYKDILNDPSSVYYSDVKNVIEGKQNQITEQYQKTKELQKQYFSENPTQEELGGHGNIFEKKFDQLQDVINKDFIVSFRGLGGYSDGEGTYVWLTNESIKDDDINKQFSNWKKMYKKTPGKGDWTKINSFNDINAGDLIANTDYRDMIAWVGSDGKLYWVKTKSTESGDYGENGRIYEQPNIGYDVNARATGDYNYRGGHVLINELGTEAIVTPQGTLTSLPSHSGIVPADLTKNLFALGEIAPNLIATLRNQMPNVSKSNSTSNDNSTNIGTVYATFNADSGFDMNRFMIDLRSAAGNTRHNN